MKKKIMAIIVAAMMIINTIPFGVVFAVDNNYERARDLAWSISPEGVLTISGNGAMPDYDFKDNQTTAPWYTMAEKAVSIVIEDGITVIGSNSFKNFKASSVDIADSVKKINTDAFAGSMITSANIEAVEVIEVRAFAYCDLLKEVIVSECIEKIAKTAFESCDLLTKITFTGYESEWKALTKTIENATFKTALIGEFVFGVYENIEWCVSKQIGAITISGDGDMPDFKKPQNAPWAAHMEGINTLVVKGGVTSLGKNAFKDNSTLTRAVLQNGVAKVREGALNCTSLDTLVISDTLTLIEKNAVNALLLANVYYDGSESDWLKLTVFEDNAPFENAVKNYMAILAGGTCGEGLAWEISTNGTLTISGTGIMDSYRETETPWSAYKPLISKIVVLEGVVTVGDRAFARCVNAESVELSSTLTDIGVGAFAYCKGLTEIELPEGITVLNSSMFTQCTELTKIAFTGKITAINDNAFSGCEMLYDFYISETVSAIGENAFSGCRSLSNITLPDSLTEIGIGAFEACSGIRIVRVPENLISIPESLFVNCTSLRRVIFDGDVAEIAPHAFEGCISLEDIGMPKSVMAIGEGAFVDCIGLTQLILTDGIEMIGPNAFMNSGVEIIYIPKSLKAIDIGAFSGCDGLSAVYYAGNEAAWTDILINVQDNLNSSFVNATRYYNAENNAPCFGYHTVVMDKAVDATMFKDGLTEGSHCSVCNNVFEEQEIIPAKLSSAMIFRYAIICLVVIICVIAIIGFAVQGRKGRK